MRISNAYLICALLPATAGATEPPLFKSGFGEWHGFANPAVYASQGVGLIDAAFADIDSDGIKDIALLYNDSRELIFFKGSQNGTFEPLAEMDTITDPEQVIFAHLDNDTHIDMLVRGYFANGFSTYLGNGNGTFNSETFHGLSGHATTMVATDLNADGLIDAAVTRSGSGQPIQLNIYFNDGSGNLTLQQKIDTVYDSAARMLVCDINDDSSPDLVMSSPTPAPIVIALSGENAVYEAPYHLEPMYSPWDGTLYFSCLDIDGDQDIDLLVTRPFREPAALSLYRNISGTGYGPAEEISTPDYQATDVSSAHIDNDRIPDLVFSAFSQTKVKVARGGSGASLALEAPASVRKVVVGAVDDNEFDDMVIFHSDDWFSVYINRGAE